MGKCVRATAGDFYDSIEKLLIMSTSDESLITSFGIMVGGLEQMITNVHPEPCRLSLQRLSVEATPQVLKMLAAK